MENESGGDARPMRSLGALFVLFLRSIFFNASMVLSVLFFSIAAMLSAVLPFRSRYRVPYHFARTVLWFLRVCCNLRHEVQGQENIPTQPCVIALKHESAWEAIAMIAIFPPQCWVLKRELMWVPFLGWGLAAQRPIAINRNASGTALDQVVEQGQARLRDQRCVMIFPEGTRVAPGKTRRYGLGAATLARRANVPLLPVAHDAGDYWPRRGWLKKPGVIRMRIAPALQPESGNRLTLTASLCESIEREMAFLRPPELS